MSVGYVVTWLPPIPDGSFVNVCNDRGDMAGSRDDRGELWYVNGSTLVSNIPGPSVLTGLNNHGTALGRVIPADATPVMLFTLDLSGTREVLLSGSQEQGIGQSGGINDPAQICGIFTSGTGFLYDLKSDTFLAAITAPQPGMANMCLNGSGETAGLLTGESRPIVGFLFKDGSLTEFGEAARIRQIGEAGQIVGDALMFAKQSSPASPVMWDTRAASILRTDIPGIVLGFDAGIACGVNREGVVVGGFDGPVRQRAFIYDGVTQDLNDLIDDRQWSLEVAWRITDRGVIFGLGKYRGEPCRFKLVPRNSLSGIDQAIVGILLGFSSQDGSGSIIVNGSRLPVPPMQGWSGLSQAQRDSLTALAIDQLAKSIGDRSARAHVRGAALESAAKLIEQMAREAREA